MDWLGFVQWPAMAATLAAAWLVASRDPRRRNGGFWIFIASNVMWIAWALHVDAYALIVLQIGLFVLNLRGAQKTDAAHEQ